MMTATIKNIPVKLTREYGNTIDYKVLVSYIYQEKSNELEKKYYNKEEDNYWPFNWSKEAIGFLTRNRW